MNCATDNHLTPNATTSTTQDASTSDALDQHWYGIDNCSADEFGLIKDKLGEHINLAIIPIPVEQTDLLQIYIDQARTHHFSLIVWPLGNGHQYTPWKWVEDHWDIADGVPVIDL